MALDPFNANRMTMVTEDSLIIVNDFSWVKVPENFKNKFNVTGPSQSVKSKSPPSAASTAEGSLRAVFSAHTRDYLYLLFPREILIMDLNINQTIKTLVRAWQ